MDRDYFLRRYDEELALAATASSDAARQAHERLAECFKEAADRVGSPEAANGAMPEATGQRLSPAWDRPVSI